MIEFRLDTTGRLIEFRAVPGDGLVNIQDDGAEPDWNAVFSAGGLDRSEMTECAPASMPPVYCDEHHAWYTGSDSGLRLEVASFRDRIVWAKVATSDDAGWMAK